MLYFRDSMKYYMNKYNELILQKSVALKKQGISPSFVLMSSYYYNKMELCNDRYFKKNPDQTGSFPLDKNAYKFENGDSRFMYIYIGGFSLQVFEIILNGKIKIFEVLGNLKTI